MVPAALRQQNEGGGIESTEEKERNEGREVVVGESLKRKRTRNLLISRYFELHSMPLMDSLFSWTASLCRASLLSAESLTGSWRHKAEIHSHLFDH